MAFNMVSLAAFLFILMLQLNEVQGATRYDTDDTEGIISIVLLAFAILVFLMSAIVFLYIVYKLWNGNFGRRHHYVRSISREKIVMHDQQDGGRYSTITTEPVYSTVNKNVVEEIASEEKEGVKVEAVRVEEQENRVEEVIVSQAPSTAQAEMETQELVIVFDNNDDVVDVITNVT